MSILVHGARLLRDGEVVDDGWVRLTGARILATGVGPGWTGATSPDDEVVDAAGALLAPGLVDLHVHGGGGRSFDEDDDEAVLTALAVHHAHGTRGLVASLVSQPVEALCARLTRLSRLRSTEPMLLGAHLEGPFLAPSRRGAHDPAALCDPTPAAVDALLSAADGALTQVTIAPERPGGLDAVRRFAEAGVVVAVGHTEASYAEARAAFDAGASLLTHAFNAMPGIHHRAPGPVLAAVDDGVATLEVIADGRHVAGPAVRLLFEAAPGRVALVTDAMAAAGTGDGDYRLGSLSVTVREGSAYLDDGVTLAGSTLTLDRAVAWAVAQGIPLVDAVRAASSTPARVLGRTETLGELSAGSDAGAVLLDDSGRVLRVLG